MIEKLPFEEADTIDYYEGQRIIEKEDILLRVWDDRIIHACRYARKAYPVINKSFFNGKLPGAEIGFYSPEDGGYAGMDEDAIATYYDGMIGFNSDAIPIDKLETLSTLAHEMVHQYCDLQGITDCVGSYHTEAYKAEAERINLICSYNNDKTGFSRTELSDAFLSQLTIPADEI